MSRDKPNASDPKFMPIDRAALQLPGTEEHPLNHPSKHAIDLSPFDAR
jgi:hypothetical protein